MLTSTDVRQLAETTSSTHHQPIYTLTIDMSLTDFKLDENAYVELLRKMIGVAVSVNSPFR